MTRKNSSSPSGRTFRLFLVLFAMLLIFAPPAVPRPSDNAQPQPAETPQPEKIPPVPQRTQAVDQWGEITVAQPKIWQYERVNALLDGLLRDVEGVSLTDLTRLDPSAPNAAAVRFVQSALGIAVQYDQAAQVNNANILQTWQAQHDVQVQQLQQYNQYIITLSTQRSQTTSQLLAAESTVATLQGQTDATGQLPSDQQKQLVDAQNRVTALKSQLTDINSMITSAGSAPTLTAPPTPQGTSASSLLPSQPALSSFADILKALPDGVQKGLTSALQSPSYPASKQLDNFITLLHERLAQEISVQQDDVLRDPENLAFLVQFDVGLYPSKKTKNHMARVEFELTHCPGCKVYSLYPGQSAYNVANYQGASHRRSFVGNLMTLIGLGITASYQRQEDALQGSLVQSVYTSGFQDDMNSSGQHEEDAAAQRFGWYYNAAPFDQYVTPGIRSTFALITVPRDIVRCFHHEPDCETRSVAGTRDLDTRAVVAGQMATSSPGRGKRKHNEPSLHYVSQSQNAGPSPDPPLSTPGSSDDLQPTLKLRANEPYKISFSLKGDWARRDDPLYQKSGFLSGTYLGRNHKSEMERTLQVALPGTDDLGVVSQAVLKDRRRLHVLRMEYNIVTSKKVNPTVSPSPTPSPTASPATAPAAIQLSPATCPKRECATVLLSLDIPIDPNLVVTVHGNVLPRVRDWRGRATSVLPPAQSASDLASAGSGSQTKTQNPISRSLLESDQLQPDSWFAVTSHDLLLNISHRLAGEEEFPVIQLSVPGKQTLVIPNDLQENTTEIITDGFRFLPPDQIQQHIRRTLVLPSAAAGSSLQQNTLVGPFPYATFMPLFQQDPVGRHFYAVVGETRKDLIVGFIREARDVAKPGHFVESRTLAVLEDPDLDLAWPLHCEKQGEELLCHLPIPAIQQGYRHVAAACRNQDDKNPNVNRCPSLQSRILPNFVSGMQLWVEQYDPDGDNAFWSPEPVKIGVLPITESKDIFPERGAEIKGTTMRSAGFKPWHFDGSHTTPATVALEECNYFGNLQANISYLTPIDFVDPQNQTSNVMLQPSGHNDDCQYITLPTASLLGPEIILQMKAGDAPSWTTDIPTAQLRPEFGHPSVLPSFEERAGSFVIKSWTVSTPVVRMHSQDRIAENLKGMGITLKLLDGDHEIDPHTCSDSCPATWWAKQHAGQIELQLTIPKSAALNLPQVLHLIRTEPAESVSPKLVTNAGPNSEKKVDAKRQQESNRGPQAAPSSPTDAGVNVTVATLSYLRDLLLPTKLKLEALGDNQFALQGRNASAIDAVALQSEGKTKIYPTAGAGDFAVIDTTPPPAPKPAPQKAPKNGQAKPVNQNASSNSDAGLAAGSYAVIPLILSASTKDNATAKNYVPIPVTNESGAPLVFTKKAAAKPANDSSASTADETITITKTKAKTAAAATPTPAPK